MDISSRAQPSQTRHTTRHVAQAYGAEGRTAALVRRRLVRECLQDSTSDIGHPSCRQATWDGRCSYPSVPSMDVVLNT